MYNILIYIRTVYGHTVDIILNYNKITVDKIFTVDSILNEYLINI